MSKSIEPAIGLNTNPINPLPIPLGIPLMPSFYALFIGSYNKPTIPIQVFFNNEPAPYNAPLIGLFY